jgi:DNA-binding response OmpR family regulator/tetratricopeptide (TPR) repeat protein
LKPHERLASENKILVIEDDTNLRRALSYFLRQKGMLVDEAMTGEEGLTIFVDKQPNLVIIDNSLPGKMGYEICKEIRSSTQGSKVPIIMISAFMKVLGIETDETEEENLVDEFLRKPFQLEQLWLTLTRMKVADHFTRPSQKSLQPLDDLQSLNHLSESTQSPTHVATTTAQPFTLVTKGSCQQHPFLSLLSQALSSQATGILTLREEKRVRRLYFANGFPVFARSNLIKESLLRYLLQQHVIDAETYRKHLSKMQRERWRPGATLVKEGVLTLTRLNQSHQLLVEYIISACFDWKNAEFDFVLSQVPVEQAVVYNINPFLILDQWLSRNQHENLLWQRVQPWMKCHLSPTPHLSSWRHMLEPLLLSDQPFEQYLTQDNVPISLLFRGNPQETNMARARLLHILFILGATHLIDEQGIFIDAIQTLSEIFDSTRDDDKPGTHSSSELDVPLDLEWPSSSNKAKSSTLTSPAPAEDDAHLSNLPDIIQKNAQESGNPDGTGLTNIQRIYEMVLKDYRRVIESSNPYDILRVARNEPIALIRKRYEQFERFYRPDHFSRLGDDKLHKLAVDIRQAMARAMVEIEAGTVIERSGTNDMSSGFSKRTGWGDSLVGDVDDPLAQIFFNDGLTYLRVSDYTEAVAHFQRAIESVPGKASFKTHLIWGEFLRDGRSREAANKARQSLERMLDQHPEEDTVYHFLAHIHREDGDLERAVSYYRKAAELNPNNRSARLFLQRLAES